MMGGTRGGDRGVPLVQLEGCAIVVINIEFLVLF